MMMMVMMTCSHYVLDLCVCPQVAKETAAVTTVENKAKQLEEAKRAV